MAELLSIGDFARATQLSVKALRHYHDEGLLAPTEIDPSTGYRRYAVDLLPVAQIIRRLRSLSMPISDIQRMLQSDDLSTRNDVLTEHLSRLRHELSSTRESIEVLERLLGRSRMSVPIERRAQPSTPAAAIVEDIEIAHAGAWLAGALSELLVVLEEQGIRPGGHAAGIYSDELFTLERGRAVAYVPVEEHVTPAGRVEQTEVPAAELAVVMHAGGHHDIDRAYSALAEYVSHHEIAVPGPIREFYLVNRQHTADRGQWRTEVGWPIFATGGNPTSAR